MDTIPAPYFYFFWLIETTCSISGAAYAIFRPQVYAEDMLPTGVEAFTATMGATVRGEMLVSGLGNCFLVLALVSLFLLPVFKWTVTDVVLQEKLMRNLLVPLAVADVTHILVTIKPLPRDLLFHPQRWSTLIHGNVDITFLLFVMRCSWLAGVGRRTAAQLQAKRGRRKAE